MGADVPSCGKMFQWVGATMAKALLLDSVSRHSSTDGVCSTGASEAGQSHWGKMAPQIIANTLCLVVSRKLVRGTCYLASISFEINLANNFCHIFSHTLQTVSIFISRDKNISKYLPILIKQCDDVITASDKNAFL